MAARRPRTIEAPCWENLRHRAKAERYGDAFLKELEHYGLTWHGGGMHHEHPPFAPAGADAVVRVSELATRITSGKVYDQTFVEEMVEIRRGRISCAAASRCTSMSPVRTTGPSSAAPPSAARTGTIQRRAACIPSSVLPEKQNRGVGRALIEAIERDPWFLTARRVIIPASINALHFIRASAIRFAPGGDTLDEEQLYCLEKFRSRAPEGGSAVRSIKGIIIGFLPRSCSDLPSQATA